ncbi:MAG: radical SAM protein [Myxococcales bacterium]|nr:radical SAM protein [Myxococcales bacterium]
MPSPPETSESHAHADPAAPSAAPTRTDLKVGFACNNRCIFCAQGEKRRSMPRVAPDELLARMKSAFAPGRGIVLTGGEPTVRKDIVHLVAEARRIGYRPIQVQTNGRMLSYGQLMADLVRAGASEISPALHGSTAEIHDALTKAPGSYEQTVAGIRNAGKAGVSLITNTVVVKSNLHDLVATVELLAELGAHQSQLAMVHPVGTAYEEYEAVVPRLDEAAPFVKAAIEAGKAKGLRMVVEALPPCFLREHPDAIIEEAIPETTVVDMDGAHFEFSEWRRDEGKAKGPPCERCTRSSACEGPWREYPEKQGWEGYVPFEA